MWAYDYRACIWPSALTPAKLEALSKIDWEAAKDRLMRQLQQSRIFTPDPYQVYLSQADEHAGT